VAACGAGGMEAKQRLAGRIAGASSSHTSQPSQNGCWVCSGMQATMCTQCTHTWCWCTRLCSAQYTVRSAAACFEVEPCHQWWLGRACAGGKTGSSWCAAAGGAGLSQVVDWHACGEQVLVQLHRSRSWDLQGVL
jgi:hypothetical protein